MRHRSISLRSRDNMPPPDRDASRIASSCNTHLTILCPGRAWGRCSILRRNFYRREFQSLLLRAGLVGEGFTLRSLGYTFANTLAAKGVNPATAQKKLGHSDIRKTLAIYTHATDEAQVAATAALENVFGESTVTVLLPRDPDGASGPPYFCRFCRTSRSGGTRIQTRDIMIFGSVPNPTVHRQRTQWAVSNRFLEKSWSRTADRYAQWKMCMSWVPVNEFGDSATSTVRKKSNYNHRGAARPLHQHRRQALR